MSNIENPNPFSSASFLPVNDQAETVSTGEVNYTTGSAEADRFIRESIEIIQNLSIEIDDGIVSSLADNPQLDGLTEQQITDAVEAFMYEEVGDSGLTPSEIQQEAAEDVQDNFTNITNATRGRGNFSQENGDVKALQNYLEAIATVNLVVPEINRTKEKGDAIVDVAQTQARTIDALNVSEKLTLMNALYEVLDLIPPANVSEQEVLESKLAGLEPPANEIVYNSDRPSETKALVVATMMGALGIDALDYPVDSTNPDEQVSETVRQSRLNQLVRTLGEIEKLTDNPRIMMLMLFSAAGNDGELNQDSLKALEDAGKKIREMNEKPCTKQTDDRNKDLEGLMMIAASIGASNKKGSKLIGAAVTLAEDISPVRNAAFRGSGDRARGVESKSLQAMGIDSKTASELADKWNRNIARELSQQTGGFNVTKKGKRIQSAEVVLGTGKRIKDKKDTVEDLTAKDDLNFAEIALMFMSMTDKERDSSMLGFMMLTGTEDKFNSRPPSAQMLAAMPNLGVNLAGAAFNARGNAFAGELQKWIVG